MPMINRFGRNELIAAGKRQREKLKHTNGQLFYIIDKLNMKGGAPDRTNATIKILDSWFFR
jgi:hypothetical protein